MRVAFSNERYKQLNHLLLKHYYWSEPYLSDSVHNSFCDFIIALNQTI